MEEINEYICKKCKKPKDYPGYYCHECRDYRLNYRKENRKLFKELGLCRTCGKHKVYGSDATCFECRAKVQAYRDKHKTPLSDEAKSKMRDYNKRTYKYRVENNLCTKCGRLSPLPGKKKCGLCSKKDLDAHMKIYWKTSGGKKRVNKNICRWCKSPDLADGKRYCKECYAKIVKHLDKVRPNYWRIDNKAVFNGKDNWHENT